MAIILVVDDRPTNRQYLVTLLGYAGHRLLEAADGQAALALTLAERPDLIIADIVMPIMDGYEFARQVRADPAIAATQIIFFTSSYVVASTRRLAEACGVAHILTKPAEPETILATVEAALRDRPVAPSTPMPEEFHREHMRVLTDALAQKVEDLEAEMAERQLAQAALAASEQRFRALIENSADGITLLDAAGNVVYTSPAVTRILGGPPAFWLGGNFLTRVHADDLPLVTVLFAQLVQTPALNLTAQFRYRRQDDSWRRLEVTATNLLNEPSVGAIVANYRDVTDRWQAEEDLRRERDLVTRIMDTSPVSIVRTNREGQFVFANPRAEQVLGLSRAEITQLTYDVPQWRITDYDGRPFPEIYLPFRQVAATGRPVYDVRHALEWPDGRRVLLSINAAPMFEANKAFDGMVAVLEDVTGLWTAERALQAAEAKYRTLIEQIPAITYVAALDNTSSTLYISPQIESLGFTAAEHMADPDLWANAIHPDDRARVQAGVARAQEVQGVLRSEYRLRARDGREVWLRDEAVVVRDEFGQPLFLQGVMFDITDRKLAEARIQRQVDYLTALREIDHAIAGSLDLRLSLTLLLTQVTTQLGIDAASVFVFNPVTGMLTQAADRGFRARRFEPARLRLGEGYAGRVALERRMLYLPNLSAQQDNPRLARALAGDSFQTYYGLPLLAKGQIRGVLELFQRSAVEASAEWLDFLNTLAGQAAIAIDNAMLFSDLQRSNTDLALAYDATIEGWSRALDLRDKETEGHSQRVTQYTLALASAFNLGAEELVHIRRGALLHDIGKMGIPDAILFKPGPLTADEMAIMRQHPDFAHQLLAPIDYLRRALDIPYCHHEKWDGTGYPRGLKGEAIPLAARLFAVADVWDALLSDRPYRAGWPQARVRAYLHEQSGLHFDPAVVNHFLHTVAERE